MIERLNNKDAKELEHIVELYALNKRKWVW